MRTYAAFNGGTAVPFGTQNYFATEMTTDGNFYTPPCTNTHVLMYPANIVTDGFTNIFCRI